MISKNFTKLNEDIKLKLCTSPHAVFVTKNPDDEKYEHIVERQEKFLQLPENIKDKMLAQETADRIKRIGEQYILEILQMASIARMVRNYYFGKVQKEEFSNVLIQEAGIDPRSANEIASYVIDNIINAEIQSLSPEIKTAKMSLIRAMEKYPKVQEQIISEKLIKISSRDYLVKGSVRNWIKDYYSVVGAGSNDVMKISGYIYHSQNAKDTSSMEKQKLSVILKSLSSNEPVTVDTEKEEIVFNIRESVNDDRPRMDMSANSNVRENTYFSGKSEGTSENDNAEKEVERLRFPQNNTTSKVNHIQGNNFNLRSDHFEERKEKTGMMSNLLGKSAEDDSIRFSTSQKLPVEMEEKEDKNS